MNGCYPVDLQPGDDPAHIAAAAVVVAEHALDAADHCDLAEMIGVPVVSPQARKVSKASPEASPEASAKSIRKARRAVRKTRCRACGYLKGSPGHELMCGSA